MFYANKSRGVWIFPIISRNTRNSRTNADCWSQCDQTRTYAEIRSDNRRKSAKTSNGSPGWADWKMAQKPHFYAIYKLFEIWYN